METEKYDEYYDITAPAGVSYKLINTSGTVKKNKSKAKADDDYYYVVKDEKITHVYIED